MFFLRLESRLSVCRQPKCISGPLQYSCSSLVLPCTGFEPRRLAQRKIRLVDARQILCHCTRMLPCNFCYISSGVCHQDSRSRRQARSPHTADSAIRLACEIELLELVLLLLEVGLLLYFLPREEAWESPSILEVDSAGPIGHHCRRLPCSRSSTCMALRELLRTHQ